MKRFGINSLPHSLESLRLKEKESNLKFIAEKRENVGDQYFLLFPHNVFYPGKDRNHL